MLSMRARLARIGAAVAVASVGMVGYEAVTQVASAAPPPVVTTDYAAYPPPGSLPAGCVSDGPGFLIGYRAFIQRPGAPAVDPFVDPGPGSQTPADRAARSLRRLEGVIQVGDQLIIRWTNWAAGCESAPVSFPLKQTTHDFFDIADDQALVREPNGPYTFRYCRSDGEGCDVTPSGFELSATIPQLHVICGFQLDVVIGSPLETVGPHGSYYQTQNRQMAQAAGLGTFNQNPPNMLIDAANGGQACTPDQRILVDKQWVGSGANPPTNVPPEFLLTVTASASDVDPTVISTATCNVSGGVFTCTYVDTASPGVLQGGLLVNLDSLLTVVETGFPGNTVDITFPVGLASKYVNCVVGGNPCLLTITNTPPPPPPPPDTTTTPPTAPDTTPPPTEPTTSPATITLPPTGTSGPAPLTIVALILLPLGATLVWFTRRRADQI
jgi:hypothetical protein